MNLMVQLKQAKMKKLMAEYLTDIEDLLIYSMFYKVRWLSIWLIIQCNITLLIWLMISSMLLPLMGQMLNLFN